MDDADWIAHWRRQDERMHEAAFGAPFPKVTVLRADTLDEVTKQIAWEINERERYGVHSVVEISQKPDGRFVATLTVRRGV